MTKKQFYILLSILLVTILIFSNPSEENHIETVKSKLKIAFKKKMSAEMLDDKNGSIESLGKGLGLLLGDTFIDKMTDGFISRDNYFFFSTTNAEYKGENKIIGFGILGNVFLSDKIENIFKNEDEIAEEDFKKNIPNSNPNDKYEFTPDMLIHNELIKDSIVQLDYIKEDPLLHGKIVKVIDGGIIVEFTKPADFLNGDIQEIGKTWEVYFDNVEFNGKSNMCKDCAEDFKNLIKVGQNIDFKMAEAICGGTACSGIWSLTYIKKTE